jgi:hypothetical protein
MVGIDFELMLSVVDDVSVMGCDYGDVCLYNMLWWCVAASALSPAVLAWRAGLRARTRWVYNGRMKGEMYEIWSCLIVAF